MGERIGNLLKWRHSIFTTILLGLATVLITPAGPARASIAAPVAGNFQGTKAAAPCGDKTKRYVDCGNGTVTDTMTGLIWLKQASCLSTADWKTATKAVASLKNGDCMLTDGSAPGDWRLPTQDEWKATMQQAKELGCTGPTLANDTGSGCISAGPTSFTGVESDYYWSSTTIETNGHAWFGDIDHGNLLNGNQINTLRVWPVRGGQR